MRSGGPGTVTQPRPRDGRARPRGLGVSGHGHGAWGSAPRPRGLGVSTTATATATGCAVSSGFTRARILLPCDCRAPARRGTGPTPVVPAAHPGPAQTWASLAAGARHPRGWFPATARPADVEHNASFSPAATPLSLLRTCFQDTPAATSDSAAAPKGVPAPRCPPRGELRAGDSAGGDRPASQAPSVGDRPRRLLRAAGRRPDRGGPRLAPPPPLLPLGRRPPCSSRTRSVRSVRGTAAGRQRAACCRGPFGPRCPGRWPLETSRPQFPGLSGSRGGAVSERTATNAARGPSGLSAALPGPPGRHLLADAPVPPPRPPTRRLERNRAPSSRLPQSRVDGNGANVPVTGPIRGLGALTADWVACDPPGKG